MQMMQPLHALLQADRDQQPQRNRPQMNPEIPPRMDAALRRMNIDHSLLLVLLRLSSHRLRLSACGNARALRLQLLRLRHARVVFRAHGFSGFCDLGSAAAASGCAGSSVTGRCTRWLSTSWSEAPPCRTAFSAAEKKSSLVRRALVASRNFVS